jgi:hypothetical protein
MVMLMLVGSRWGCTAQCLATTRVREWDSMVEGDLAAWLPGLLRCGSSHPDLAEQRAEFRAALVVADSLRDHGGFQFVV